MSCSSFLIATSASAAACFFALMTSSSSRSSVSNRVSVARSSCSRRSASPCSACPRHFGWRGSVIVVCTVSSGDDFVDGCRVHTSLFATLSVRDLSSWRILSIPAEALESVSRAAAMSDSICSVSTTDFSDRDDGKNCYTFTDQAPVSPCAFLSVESSRPQLASAMPPFVSEYSPERRN